LLVSGQHLEADEVSWITVAASVLLGLAVNEVFDVSPWMARRVALLAARVWTRDPALQATYAEEWQAVIAEQPGKLSKLLTAAGFLGVGLAVRAWTEVEDWAVLGWVSLSPSLRVGSSKRHAAPPKWVSREGLPRRISRLRQALWAAEHTPTVVRTATKVASHTHCPRERSEALLVAAIGLLNGGQDHEFTETLQRARETLPESRSSRLAAQLDVLSALVAARRGEYGNCLTALSQTVPQLVAAEPTYETAFVWHDLAAVCSHVGLHDHAVAALRQAVAVGRDLGVPDGHLANPGIHLRRALWFDHIGDVSTCFGLLRSLIEEYHSHEATGALGRMRETALASYGYAMARQAALDHSPNQHAQRLLAATKNSKAGQDMRTLGDACLAIAVSRPDLALATLDPISCDSLTWLGRGEPHRVRALAMQVIGDPDGGRAANQQSREAALAERRSVQHAHPTIPDPPRRPSDGNLTSTRNVQPASHRSRWRTRRTVTPT
jgi:hypothetical protein